MEIHKGLQKAYIDNAVNSNLAYSPQFITNDYKRGVKILSLIHISLRVTMQLPHRGAVTGMGIPKGITLIVGGGYHGNKSNQPLLDVYKRQIPNFLPVIRSEIINTLIKLISL